MSVYKCPELYLVSSIESILKQTYSNIEFIIVDDGAGEKEKKIINKYKKLDSRIYIIEQKNTGLTKSLNKSILFAKGDFIARQDADDISKSDRLEVQLNYFKSDSSLSILGTSIDVIDSCNIRLYSLLLESSYEKIMRTYKNKNHFVHGSIMVRKNTLSKIFKYDTKFVYSQDFALWSELLPDNVMYNTSERLYLYRKHNSSISYGEKALYQAFFASVIIYQNNFNVKVELSSDIQKDILIVKQNQKIKALVFKILFKKGQSKLLLNILEKTDRYYLIVLFDSIFNISSALRYIYNQFIRVQ
jgi:glycosyltransferase involved in cell wall biosynthesis